jgi:hypothetical protein
MEGNQGCYSILDSIFTFCTNRFGNPEIAIR